MISKENNLGGFFKSPFFISYLITDPKEYGDKISIFERNLRNNLSNNSVDFVCFRDKETKDIKSLVNSFIKISKEFNINKILINSNIELALKYGFDGVHLTSNQFNDIKTAKKNKLFTIISCHTEDEIKLAKKLKSDAVTYSPIFYKENKGKPKGVDDLKNIVLKYQTKDFKIIALGGIINNKQIETIKNTQVSGFASIRYFISL